MGHRTSLRRPSSRAAAFVGGEQRLGRREVRALHLLDAADRLKVVGEMGVLREAGELRVVVEPHVDDAPNALRKQRLGGGSGGLPRESDRAEVHRGSLAVIGADAVGACASSGDRGAPHRGRSGQANRRESGVAGPYARGRCRRRRPWAPSHCPGQGTRPRRRGSPRSSGRCRTCRASPRPQHRRSRSSRP